MIAKLIKDNWSYIVILLMAIVLTVLAGNNIRIRKDKSRLENNQIQMLKDYNSKVLEITKKEFKKYYVQQDSLLRELKDSLKLNYRHIERTITHKYESSFDTTITMIKENGTTGNQDLTPRKFRIEKDCVELIAMVDWKKNTATIVTDIKYNATTLYYWKRKHRIWFIRFGKKEHIAVTKNNCTGETRVTEIKFKK